MSVKTLNEARPSDDDSKCLLTGLSVLRGAEVEGTCHSRDRYFIGKFVRDTEEAL